MAESQPIASQSKNPSGKPVQQAPVAYKEARGIVRILGKDLKGNIELQDALPKIRGIGRSISKSLVNSVFKELKIEPEFHVGDLTDTQIQSIESILKDPVSHGVKSFMVNRPKDPETGTPKHTLQTDLQLALRNDVEHEKGIHSWIGWRISIGQKVHGQHNRTTGRTGLTVGVLKKALKSQKEAASKTAQDSTKKPAEKK